MQISQHDPISKLIFELSKLPGIGEKTATRLSYFILKQEENFVRTLADSLLNAKQQTSLCKCCFTFTDTIPCKICTHPDRDPTLLCIVETPADVFSIEQSGVFKGRYHVLHGVLSPLDGIGPEELKIRELLLRIEKSGQTDQEPSSEIREIILAMNPSIEGEATSLYLTRLMRPFGIRLTKLAHGLPVGGMLEYTDKQTIGKALENRMEMS